MNKGKKQIGQIVAAEKGELVTFCGIVSAIGLALPPVFVFTHVRFKDKYLNGAQTFSLGLSSHSGWMVADLFIDVLELIQKRSYSMFQ